MNYLPRWSIWTFRSYNHSQRLLIWLLGQGQLIRSVIGHIADSAALTGLTFHPHRSDRSDQSAQNANCTSPLRRSRRDNRNAYVERLVRSPDEGVIVLERTSPVPDRSHRWDPTVWPVLAAKSELGVVFWCRICTGARPPHPIFMKVHGRLRDTQSNLSLPCTFYPLNTFSNLHASRLFISMTWDGILGPAGQPRARRGPPRLDGVPPRQELRRPLLVCS
jgi:hypothetical protein